MNGDGDCEEISRQAMRWIVTGYYLTDVGMIDVEWELEELDELPRIVERGPSFYTIDHIEIRHTSSVRETIESALQK